MLSEISQTQTESITSFLSYEKPRYYIHTRAHVPKAGKETGRRRIGGDGEVVTLHHEFEQTVMRKPVALRMTTPNREMYAFERKKSLLNHEPEST